MHQAFKPGQGKASVYTVDSALGGEVCANHLPGSENSGIQY